MKIFDWKRVMLVIVIANENVTVDVLNITMRILIC